jgi:hypothetical protein
VTFATAATLSLNGVFSSLYDNYIIAHTFSADNTADTTCYHRLRLSGTDNTTANSYVSQRIQANGTTVGGIRQTNDIAFSFVTSNNLRSGAQMFLYGPNLAQPTAARSVDVNGISGAHLEEYAWTHNQSTGYDGITIIIGSGTMAGLIKVYGLVQ